MASFLRRSNLRTVLRKNYRAVLAALFVLPVWLTACSGSGSDTEAIPSPSVDVEVSAEPSASPTQEEAVEPTNTLDGIKVTGGVGENPKIQFEAPMAIDITRSQVLVSGKGTEITEDAIVEINYRGVLGRTGEEFDSTFDDGQPAVFPINQTVKGFAKGLVGQHVGDRVLLAIPGSEAYDDAVEAGVAPAWAQAGDTLIFVVDVLATSFGEPTGIQVDPKYRDVTVSVDKTPEIKISASAKPPVEMVVQTIVAGEGRKVTENDYLVARYRTWLWRDGKLVEDKFDKFSNGRLSDLIETWKKGLPGQTTGSRVLIVAPASDSYPAGNPKIGVDSGDVLIFVIDIAFASPHMA